jgi:hypothetical protein
MISFFTVRDRDYKTLVRDSEGAIFSSAGHARKEAVGWARDFTRHGFKGLTEAWKIFVIDEYGDEVLTVPLSGDGHDQKATPGKPQGLATTSAQMTQEVAITRVGFFGLILVAASIQLAGWMGNKENGVPYQTASAPAEGVSFAVRFVGEATAAEIAAFLETYKATIIAPAFGRAPSRSYFLLQGFLRRNSRSSLFRLDKRRLSSSSRCSSNPPKQMPPPPPVVAAHPQPPPPFVEAAI